MWPFKDAKNTTTIVSRHIFANDPICYAYHDWDDGTWQFLPERETLSADAKIVCLGDVYKLDPSIGELSDLPLGWMAHRNSLIDPWQRQKHHPFPVFADDGFYLEEATLYEQAQPDLYKIPEQTKRESLGVGDVVKLIFRFAPEHAARHDNECERMWVEVQKIDPENFIYQGELLNQPLLHTAITQGHHLHFHPSHVFALE